MSGESKQDPFEKLPSEIHQLILTKVDKATLLECRLLSRRWRTRTDDVLRSQEKSVWAWKSYDPEREANRDDEFKEESMKLRRVGCVYLKGREAMEDFGRCVLDGFPYSDDDKHSVFNAGHQGPFPSGSAIYNVIHEYDESLILITYPEIITPSFGRFLTSFTFGNFEITAFTKCELVQLLSRIPNIRFLKIVGCEDRQKSESFGEQDKAEGDPEVQTESETEIRLPELASLETLILYDPYGDQLLNLLLNQYGQQLRHLEFYDEVGYEMGYDARYLIDDDDDADDDTDDDDDAVDDADDDDDGNENPERNGEMGNARRLRDRSYFDIATPLQEKMTSLKDLKVEMSLALGATIQTHNIPLLERLCLEANHVRNFRDFDLFPCLQLLNQFHASLKVFSLLLDYPICATIDHEGNHVPTYDHSQWDLEYIKYSPEQKKIMDQSFPLLEQITVPADLARNSPAFWALLRKGGSALKEVELVRWEYQQNPSPEELEDIMDEDLDIVTGFFNRIWNDYPSVKKIKIHLTDLPNHGTFRDVFIATRNMFDEGKQIFRAMYNLD